MRQVVVLPVQLGVESLFHELDDGAFAAILELVAHVLVLYDGHNDNLNMERHSSYCACGDVPEQRARSG